MNKKRVFNYSLITLLVLLGVYFILAVSLPTINPPVTNANISGTFNITANSTTDGSHNQTVNVSFWYGTDNSTWTFIGSEKNATYTQNIFSFNWSTGSLADSPNMRILAVSTNLSMAANSANFTNTTHDGIRMYEVHNITIDNNAPTVGASTDITSLNVSMVGNAAAPIANASLNGNSYLRNGTDIFIRLYITEVNLKPNSVYIYYNKTGGPVRSGNINLTALNSSKGIVGVGNATLMQMTNLTGGTNLSLVGGTAQSLVNSPSVWQANITAPNFTATSAINLSFAIAINDSVNHFTIIDNGGNSYKVAFGGTDPSATITQDKTSISVQGAVKITCSVEAGGVGENTSATYIYWQKPSEVATDSSTSYQIGERTFQNEETGEAGTYYTWCTAADNNGRTASTGKLSVDALYDTAGPPDTGGDGGSSSGATSTIEEEIVLDISTKSGEVSGPAGGFVRFTVDGTTKHKLTFNEVTATSTTITIESEPIKTTLNIAETKELDLNGDGLNDISATLTRIVDNQAVVKLEKLATQTPAEAAPVTEEQPSVTEKAPRSLLWLWILIAIIVIALVIYFIKRKK